eukprot:435010_1
MAKSTSTSPLISDADTAPPKIMINEDAVITDEPLEDSTDSDDKGNPSVQWLISLLTIGVNIAVAFATNTYFECGMSLGINLISFVCIAWPLHTEKYYDFTGMITFLSCDIFSMLYRQVPWTTDYIRNIVLFFMVMVWTLRLGLFLFMRILGEKGGDKRFENMRNNFPRFLVAWCLQATWAYFCCMPLFITNQIDNEDLYRATQNNYTVLDIIGWALWAIGWGIEIIADRQKSVFKKDATNRGKFCNVGLWAYSRHPNYFGEITLWIGIFISAASVAYGRGWLIVLSPVWTIILLVFASGIPLAERTSLKKYGQQEEYQQYIKDVSVLIPLPCCWKGYI